MSEDYEYKLEWTKDEISLADYWEAEVGISELDFIEIKRDDRLGDNKFVVTNVPWELSTRKAFSSLHEAKIWCEKNYIFALERELERMKG